jgi:hypothetical protein
LREDYGDYWYATDILKQEAGKVHIRHAQKKNCEYFPLRVMLFNFTGKIKMKAVFTWDDIMG